MSNPTPTVLYNPYVRIPFGVLFPHNSEHAVEARRKKRALSSSTPPQNQQQLGQKRSRDEDDVHTTTTDDSGSSRSTIIISSETKIDDVLRERTRQGAAMGITRALDLRKEEADLKHLSTTGGGGDNSSSITRIANQVAMLQSSDIGVNRETGEAMLGGGVQAPPPKPSSSLPPSFNESTAASTTSTSTTRQLPPKILESHLEFQCGKDGKHIIATAAPGRSASAVTVPHGKPSSTLIIRNLVLRDVFYGRRPSPTNNHQSTTTATTVDVATQARTAAAYREKIIAEVSAECRNCGHVRDIVVCDMYQQCSTSSSSPPSSSSTTSTNTNTAFPYPTMPMLAPSSPPPQNSIGPLDSCSSLNSQRDAIVVWVRMDTVMNGFKAAQRLNGGKVFLGDPSRLVVAGFYPSPTFDAGIRTTNNDVLNSTNANVGGCVASPTPSSSSPPSFNVAATTSSTNQQQVVVVESLEKLLPAQYLNR